MAVEALTLTTFQLKALTGKIPALLLWWCEVAIALPLSWCKQYLMVLYHQVMSLDAIPILLQDYASAMVVCYTSAVKKYLRWAEKLQRQGVKYDYT